MEESIFKQSKSAAVEISAAAYNLAIGATLVWGFAVNWLMVKNISVEVIATIDPMMFFIGYFVSCLVGVCLFNASTNPLVSFVGYNFVVVPFGLVLNLVVSNYDPELVSEAIRITGLVTAGMMFLGSMFPKFFERISGALGISLLLVIVVSLFDAFFFGINHEVVDWIVVVIFCGYIGYDWGKANQIPKTLDNAIDSAAELYIDIINLFVRILRILGRK